MVIPPRESFVDPAVDFVLGYTHGAGIPEEKRQALARSARTALERMVREASSTHEFPSLAVKLHETPSRLLLAIQNRGAPIFVREDEMDRARTALERGIDGVEIYNLGRDGQAVIFEITRDGEDGDGASPAQQIEADKIEIRPLGQGEEYELSRLFYSVYGYDYGFEFVYHPERMRDMIEEGSLISMVAAAHTADGVRLVSHVGLQRLNEDPPVYSDFGGITHPRMKSRGVFGQVFRAVMERAEVTPMLYQVVHYTTNHDFAQRRASPYGSHEICVDVGCLSKEAQAKLQRFGLNDAGDVDRYTLITAVLPRTASPFGYEIQLPENLGEMLGFLLGPLGLSWTPASRFDSIPTGGHYEVSFEQQQSAVFFDFVRPGRDALLRIADDWHAYLRDGYQYAAVDIPLRSHGLSQIYEVLGSHGFFAGGFVPYRNGGGLALRLQAVGAAKVDFDKIHAFTPNAKRLLEVVRNDYERNHIL